MTTITLSKRALTRARRAVAGEHPELRRIVPDVNSRADGSFTLTYRAEIARADGGVIRKLWRVTVNKKGEVLQVLASR